MMHHACVCLELTNDGAFMDIAVLDQIEVFLHLTLMFDYVDKNIMFDYPTLVMGVSSVEQSDYALRFALNSTDIHYTIKENSALKTITCFWNFGIF
jgi:hypothetical protein